MDFKLVHRHFVVNIAKSNSTKGGILLLNRDPRKERYLPDAYPGVVEDVADSCTMVKPGDTVVIQRWKYKQFDLDDERLIAHERYVLLNGEEAAPHTCVLQLPKDHGAPSTKLILTDETKDQAKRKIQCYYGRVLSSGILGVYPGDLLWVEKRERDQFFLNPEVFIFKYSPDLFSGDYPIFMKGEPCGDSEPGQPTTERSAVQLSVVA